MSISYAEDEAADPRPAAGNPRGMDGREAAHRARYLGGTDACGPQHWPVIRSEFEGSRSGSFMTVHRGEGAGGRLRRGARALGRDLRVSGGDRRRPDPRPRPARERALRACRGAPAVLRGAHASEGACLSDRGSRAAVGLRQGTHGGQGREPTRCRVRDRPATIGPRLPWLPCRLREEAIQPGGQEIRSSGVRTSPTASGHPRGATLVGTATSTPRGTARTRAAPPPGMLARCAATACSFDARAGAGPFFGCSRWRAIPPCDYTRTPPQRQLPPDPGRVTP